MFLTGWVLGVLLVTLTLIEVVRSTPLEAQLAVCEDTTFQHDGIEPQISVAPYQLEVSADAVVGGQALSIFLSSPSGELFEGFFIQARDVVTDEIIGTFHTEEWKNIDCKPGVKNTVTHSGDSTKTSITVDWIAPEDYDGVVVLRATVVQQSHTFWVGIESTEVIVTPAHSLVNTRTPANTSVMACRSYNGEVDVVMAFNTVGHASDILPIPDMGLSDISTSHVDGLLYCSFNREASLVVGGYLYDMDNDEFYLEVAHGNLSDTGALTHHKHQGTTPDPVLLASVP
ncbi:Reeler domain [Trinorchestia longiramus]|nr:Reeler domain [Trinorchestia longiramus]